MKMRAYTILIHLTIILSCCSNPKSTQEVASIDSSSQVKDTLITQIEENISSPLLPIDETAEPFSGITNNFPNLSMDVLTSDALEADINSKVAEIIQAFDTMQYARIISSYSWERPFYAYGQEGEGSMAVETEEETKIWFFDRSTRLRGFSTEYKSESDFPYTKSTLYLFSNDSLIAVIEHAVDDSEVSVTDRVILIAAQCPRCGTATTGGHQENGEVRYSSEKDLAWRQQAFFGSMPELIQTLKAGRKNAEEDDIYFQFEVNGTQEANPEKKAEAITYPITFMVEKDLYPNYISRQ